MCQMQTALVHVSLLHAGALHAQFLQIWNESSDTNAPVLQSILHENSADECKSARPRLSEVVAIAHTAPF